MRILMSKSQLGSRDGIKAELFEAGVEYDLTHAAGERDLAAVFVREGWAREVLQQIEVHAHIDAPENKASDGRDEATTKPSPHRKPGRQQQKS